MPEASLAAADYGLAAEDSLRGLVMTTFGDNDRLTVAHIVAEEWLRNGNPPRRLLKARIKSLRQTIDLSGLPVEKD